MDGDLLVDPRLFSWLGNIDAELAEEARVAGCPDCGGSLHRSDYARRPRGLPNSTEPADARRTSFCCSRDGCRRRVTPASVRFFGRKVYAAPCMVLVSALRYGPTKERQEQLRTLLGVSRRTLERWRQWWLGTFTRTRYWRSMKALIAPPADEARLPAAIIERVQAADSPTRLVHTLRVLSPVTTGSATAVS
jgi:hypothetical protein